MGHDCTPVEIPDDCAAPALAAFLKAHTDRRLLRDPDGDGYVIVDVGSDSDDSNTWSSMTARRPDD